MRYGGFFAPNPPNKMTLEEIIERGKEIDEDLACGKQVMADLTKDEKRMLGAWRNRKL